MAAQLTDIRQRFDTVYGALNANQRSDVRAAQDALAELSRALAVKSRFEHDVENALGSGSRQQIVGLATRWWKGEEQALAVKKLAGDLRRQLDNLPNAGK